MADPITPHPPSDEPLDIMNDAAYNPQPPSLTRQNTATTQHSSTPDTCRICRSESTPDEPLFHPCKCSGSIKFVHQECLIEWLSHSHKKHCELCKTPFRFTKLYDANMPSALPWRVFLKRVGWHTVLGMVRAARLALVGFVWFAVIPYCVRWVWRWLFWLADAAWAREDFMAMMRRKEADEGVAQGISWMGRTFQQYFAPLNETALLGRDLGRERPFMMKLMQGLGMIPSNVTSAKWAEPEPSMLSDWTYLSAMTSNAHANRLILDVFEGQLITCVILTSFILVFLLREWVVQQQPLANLDNLNNVQAQMREATEQMQAENERLARQQELLDQARVRLAEIERENHGLDAGPEGPSPFIGWNDLDKLIDDTTQHLRQRGEYEHDLFLAGAKNVTEQIRAAGRGGEGVDDFTEKVFRKLAGYPEAERKEWEMVLVSEIERATGKVRPPSPRVAAASGSVDDTDASTRPRMPDREGSSRATQVQRSLQEGASDSSDVSNASNVSIAPSSVRSNDSSSGSWQDIIPPVSQPESTTDDRQAVSSPAAQQNTEKKLDEPNLHKHIEFSTVSLRSRTLPVRNAGTDVTIKVQRHVFVNEKGETQRRAPLRIVEKMVDVDEAKKQLEAEVEKEEKEAKAEGEKVEVEGEEREQDDQEDKDDQPSNGEILEEAPSANNHPFHPEGPNPAPQSDSERRSSENFGDRVASVFREEFGLDEAEELENLRQNGLDADGNTAPNDGNIEAAEPRREDPPELGKLARLFDWFWGDLWPSGAQEPVPEAREEIQHVDDMRREGEQEAPFVPVQDGEPHVAQAQAEGEEEQQQQNDPEVVAAAQQAGLDAEAIEDAEDLEGIFELVGVQGPLIGLFQTSAFCMLLVACTIVGAVSGPYLTGKLALSFVANPLYFVVQLPLQVASGLADFVIDFCLLVGGWATMGFAIIMDWLLSFTQVWFPATQTGLIWPKVIEYSGTTASKAFARLATLFSPALSTDKTAGPWWFLYASVHAHASLRTIQEETRAVLDFTSHAITTTVNIVASGTVTQHLWSGIRSIPSLPSYLPPFLHSLGTHLSPIWTTLKDLIRGRLNFSTPPSTPLDPTLVYWSSTDRALAIAAGYATLATLAAIYVTLDTPLTRSPLGRKREKLLRDSLRQAGGVLKVILIISIEMLLFPLYCGILLDLAFLPLFGESSVATRWQYAGEAPFTFGFVHWFVGTGYMFHFALFVGMCRKILRKGVLWFIRDPDDPEFHPVRDVLERNVVTQLRRVAFSALVYGALVILCLGGVIWTIGKVFRGVFPICWTSTEPVLEFPMDLLLYNFATPLVIKLFRPSKVVNRMYAWWLRRCARLLRLSHFLFDDRKRDEEGYTVRAGKIVKKVDAAAADARADESKDIVEDAKATPSEESSSSTPRDFQKSGTYILTPSSDSYRPPKANELSLHVEGDDIYIGDAKGKRSEHFAKVYIPPFFRVRLALFMVCLWAFSAFIGLCVTLVPLVFGRRLFGWVLPGGVWVNDIYAYLLGAYILGVVLFAALQGPSAYQWTTKKAREVNIKAAAIKTKNWTLRGLKCAYVYGFLGIVLPLLMAVVLQMYFILPLATYIASSNTPDDRAATNTTAPLFSPTANITAAPSSSADLLVPPTAAPHADTLADHTLHLLREHALGILYVRIFARTVLHAPTSRAAEAFRRITAAGYMDPAPGLATRYFILPIVLLSTVALFAPPFISYGCISLAQTVAPALWKEVEDEEMAKQIVRYSYACFAATGLGIWGAVEVARASKRWRMRVRDEVYLVGERLHNFGEVRPPVGSRSVVRKEGR